MRLSRLIILCLCTALTACTRFPALESALSPGAEDAPYPDLLPIETLTARVPDPLIADDSQDALAIRAARLRARAARLRGTVLDTDSRARMQAGIGEI